MKKNKILITFVIAFTLFLVPHVVHAADASISASKTSIEVGETITITASVSATEAWNLKLTASGGTLSGTTESTDAADGETSKQIINATFTASSAGTYTITLSGEITGGDLVKKSVNKPATITVNEKEKTAPTLSSIQIASGPSKTTYTEGESFDKSGMSVKATYSDGSSKTVSDFSVTDGSNLVAGKTSVTISFTEGGVTKTTSQSITVNKKQEEQKVSSMTGVTVDGTKYNDKDKITVENDVSEVTVRAVGESKYYISVNGKSSSVTVKLEEGTNKVIVTDDNGGKYTLYISRKAAEQETTPNVVDESEEQEPENSEEPNTLQLSKLEIEGLTLSPAFSPDVYSYTTKIDMDQKDYSKINVTAIANVEDAKVKIDGTEDLVEGENIVNIIVTSADESQNITYQIVVNKVTSKSEVVETVAAPSNEENKMSDEQKNIIIASIAAIILILIIIVTLVIHHKKDIDLEDEEGNLYDYDSDDNDTEIEEQEDLYTKEEIQENNIEEETTREEKKPKGRRYKGKHE